LAMRTTPAVCELEGPIITGPIISKTLLFSGIRVSNAINAKRIFYKRYFILGARYFYRTLIYVEVNCHGSTEKIPSLWFVSSRTMRN
jgi:hypothetical protein